jgi:uncharacterized cupin superfamily protein
VLSGTPTLVTDAGEQTLQAGQCVGFPAGGVPHHLANRGPMPVTILEIGDRTPGDTVEYPVDDLAATLDANGAWVFSRKDGTPW